jgi:hypothetical protein
MMKVFGGAVALLVAATIANAEPLPTNYTVAPAPPAPSALDRVGKLLNLEETQRPWSTTTTLQLQAPMKGAVEPFIAVAHESHVTDDRARIGYGAGARIKVGRNASFATEVLHFSGETAALNSSFAAETRAMVRFQIEF